jgi:hypothetical protein
VVNGLWMSPHTFSLPYHVHFIHRIAIQYILYLIISLSYFPHAAHLWQVVGSHQRPNSSSLSVGYSRLWHRVVVTPAGGPVRQPHGLINYIDTKAECRHLKNWPLKWLCGMCFSVWGSLPSSDPIPPPLTLYMCILYTYSHRKGGRELTREKVRGATVYKAGSKILTWVTVSPVFKLW